MENCYAVSIYSLKLMILRTLLLVLGMNNKLVCVCLSLSTEKKFHRDRSNQS